MTIDFPPTMPVRTITLNTGKQIPVIAFGTGTSQAGTDSSDVVAQALERGYVHLDCAWHYKNQQYTGKALGISGLSRQNVFITTKGGDFDGKPEDFDARKFLVDSLKELNIDFVDLYLIHADILVGSVTDAWQQMEELYTEGLAKSIGVSNFSTKSLEEILAMCTVKPAVNQIEMHPYSLPTYLPTLIPLCEKHDIKLMHFGPLVSIIRNPGGPVDRVVRSIADERGFGETDGQILLQWGQQVTGGIVVTTSKNPSRMEEQIKPFLVETERLPLTEEHILRIKVAGMEAPYRHWGKSWPNFMNGEGGIQYADAVRGNYGKH